MNDQPPLPFRRPRRTTPRTPPAPRRLFRLILSVADGPPPAPSAYQRLKAALKRFGRDDDGPVRVVKHEEIAELEETTRDTDQMHGL